MYKKLKIAKHLASVADELEKRNLIEEAEEVNDIFESFASEVRDEIKMRKESQLISPEYRTLAEQAGAGAGALAGLKAGKGWGKLGLGLLGAGLGAGAGLLSTSPTQGLFGAPRIEDIDVAIANKMRELNDLRRQKATLLAQQITPEEAEQYRKETLRPSLKEQQKVEEARSGVPTLPIKTINGVPTLYGLPMGGGEPEPEGSIYHNSFAD